VVVFPREGQHGHRNLSQYIDGRIDGIIVRCFVPADDDFLAALAATGTPVIALWSHEVPDGVGYVDVDHYGGMYAAMQHLVELGHRRIAFATGSDDVHENLHFPARLAAYRQALTDSGVTPDPAWIVSNAEEVLALLSGPKRVTAVCAFNDNAAREVAAAVERLGQSIPHDLSLVGFDNLHGSESVARGLTTVNHPIHEMGREAIRRLVALIDGAPLAECRVILPTSLVVRRSTARLRRRPAGLTRTSGT